MATAKDRQRLDQALSSPQTYRGLYNSLVQEMSEENLLFLNEVDDYKKLPENPVWRRRKAELIFEKYVALSAAHQINIPASVRNPLIEKLSNLKNKQDSFQRNQTRSFISIEEDKPKFKSVSPLLGVERSVSEPTATFRRERTRTIMIGYDSIPNIKEEDLSLNLFDQACDCCLENLAEPLFRFFSKENSILNMKKKTDNFKNSIKTKSKKGSEKELGERLIRNGHESIWILPYKLPEKVCSDDNSENTPSSRGSGTIGPLNGSNRGSDTNSTNSNGPGKVHQNIEWWSNIIQHLPSRSLDSKVIVGDESWVKVIDCYLETRVKFGEPFSFCRAVHDTKLLTKKDLFLANQQIFERYVKKLQITEQEKKTVKACLSESDCYDQLVLKISKFINFEYLPSFVTSSIYYEYLTFRIQYEKLVGTILWFRKEMLFLTEDSMNDCYSFISHCFRWFERYRHPNNLSIMRKKAKKAPNQYLKSALLSTCLNILLLQILSPLHHWVVEAILANESNSSSITILNSLIETLEKATLPSRISKPPLLPMRMSQIRAGFSGIKEPILAFTYVEKAHILKKNRQLILVATEQAIYEFDDEGREGVKLSDMSECVDFKLMPEGFEIQYGAEAAVYYTPCSFDSSHWAYAWLGIGGRTSDDLLHIIKTETPEVLQQKISRQSQIGHLPVI